MINCFDFDDAEKLRPQARRLVEPILTLRAEMDRLKAPRIYVNDNFGEWHSEKSKLVRRALGLAADVVAPLAPREEDYFVIKPQFSGFYATSLPLLLPKLGASRLILTGVATDICVLFTAADAHMRDYALWVPEDAVAAERKQRSRASLDIMQAHMGAASLRRPLANGTVTAPLSGPPRRQTSSRSRRAVRTHPRSPRRKRSASAHLRTRSMPVQATLGPGAFLCGTLPEATPRDHTTGTNGQR